MQPEVRRRAAPPNRGLLLGTGLVLVLAFVAVVVLFFVFSSFTPAIIGKCVAVVDVDYPLTVEGAPPSVFGGEGYPSSEQLAATIESLNRRDDVGAVVFVFNSPGGSVVATREVYAAVNELDKPSVSYFREVAASGAYYVASGTDYIVSDPDALTGSIGVIATFTDMQGLLEKVGVNVTAIKSGPHKDIGSPYRNMTDEETAILQELIDEVYSEFRGIVVENRGKKLDMSKFDNITDGRIMSGRQAYRVGLVDALGSKKDAVVEAARLAGVEAGSYEDVRTCPVSAMGTDASLLGLEALIGRVEAQSGIPAISFK
ncbi:MAG: signal peptide peptidase SppA [Candidatus Micrarchaeota archaeon]